MEEDHVTLGPPEKVTKNLRVENPDIFSTYVDGISSVIVDSDIVKVIFFEKIPGGESTSLQKPVQMLAMSKRVFVSIARILRDMSEGEDFSDVKPLPVKIRESSNE